METLATLTLIEGKRTCLPVASVNGVLCKLGLPYGFYILNWIRSPTHVENALDLGSSIGTLCCVLRQCSFLSQ